MHRCRSTHSRPPHLSDLNPLDIYLWGGGHLHTLVYMATLDNEEALPHRIVDACQTTCNCRSVSIEMQQSMKRCVEANSKPHGGHLEHLLETLSFSCFTN